MSSAGRAKRQAAMHKKLAEQWTPRFLGIVGDLKAHVFHEKVSSLYFFSAQKGISTRNLDDAVADGIRDGSYDLGLEGLALEE